MPEATYATGASRFRPALCRAVASLRLQASRELSRPSLSFGLFLRLPMLSSSRCSPPASFLALPPLLLFLPQADANAATCSNELSGAEVFYAHNW